MTLYDDVRRVSQRLGELEDQVKHSRDQVKQHEEQINGKRGLGAAIDELADEVHGLRKAAYWVAGVLITSSIGFAFSVLTVFSP